LKEQFGMNYIIDFLWGSQSARIKAWHKDLKTYGIGKDTPKETWKDYIHQLIDEGWLKQEGEYPVLKLTEQSMEVLHGEEKVFLVKHKETTLPATGKQKPIDVPDRDEVLFNALRQTRKEIADRENVPAFVVFSDATLTELATYLPQNKEDMENIS